MHGRIYFDFSFKKTVLFIITIHVVEIIYIFLMYVQTGENKGLYII